MITRTAVKASAAESPATPIQISVRVSRRSCSSASSDWAWSCDPSFFTPFLILKTALHRSFAAEEPLFLIGNDRGKEPGSVASPEAQLPG